MLTRREFIKLCLSTVAGVGLSQALIPQLAQALSNIEEKPSVIWLEMTTCAGDYFSFLNAFNPNLRKLLLDTIELQFSNTLMFGEGHVAIDALEKVVERKKGEFILVAEGTVPTKEGGRYGTIGKRRDGKAITYLEAIRTMAPKAKYIMAVGTCAAFGGPFAAHPNPTGSKPVHKVIEQQVINIPGCPVHPDWVTGTLTHLLLYGVPNLDAYGRPTLFFSKNIHDHCPRRQYYENHIFAKVPGEPYCLYKIGCKGPVTYSDCPEREWIGQHNNWPIGANTPCIGCVSPHFPDKMSPFFEHLPDLKVPTTVVNAKNAGFIATGAAVAALAAHGAASVAKGRLHKYHIDGTQTSHLKEEGIEDNPHEKLKEIVNTLDEVIEQQQSIKYEIGTLMEKKSSKKGLFYRIKRFIRKNRRGR